MHHDNLTWAETMKAWSLDPANKKNSVAGDDRSPAHRWIGSMYFDSGVAVIPADNLMTVLREGGKRCPTGKGQQTFKSQTQSGLVVNEAAWPIIGASGPVQQSSVEALITEADFQAHERAAFAMGFSLFVKRARIGAAKHVRVRPRFDVWSAAGTVTFLDDMITGDLLATILTYAGTYAGVGDWRPSSPKSPGPFGKFNATVKEIKR
jgi:hypothetical protein